MRMGEGGEKMEGEGEEGILYLLEPKTKRKWPVCKTPPLELRTDRSLYRLSTRSSLKCSEDCLVMRKEGWVGGSASGGRRPAAGRHSRWWMWMSNSLKPLIFCQGQKTLEAHPKTPLQLKLQWSGWSLCPPPLTERWPCSWQPPPHINHKESTSLVLRLAWASQLTVNPALLRI